MFKLLLTEKGVLAHDEKSSPERPISRDGRILEFDGEFHGPGWGALSFTLPDRRPLSIGYALVVRLEQDGNELWQNRHYEEDGTRKEQP